MKTTYVRVIAKLSCRQTDPQALVGRRAYLYDADPLRDDLLSSSVVQADGTSAFLFDLSSSSSFDSLFERKPDLYLLVRNEQNEVIYRSATLRNLDFLRVDPVSQEQQRTMQVEFHEQAE